MKKLLALLLALTISVSMVACGSAEPVGGIDKDLKQQLESAGIDPDNFAEKSPEEQQAIMDELGISANRESNKPPATPKPKQPTLEDVSGQGSYVVTVGDSMLWNTFELYYEDGVLVKIVTSFQKNSDEEAMVDTVEGADAVAACEWFFIDYTQNPQDLVNSIKDKQEYTQVYIQKAE